MDIHGDKVELNKMLPIYFPEFTNVPYEALTSHLLSLIIQH